MAEDSVSLNYNTRTDGSAWVEIIPSLAEFDEIRIRKLAGYKNDGEQVWTKWSKEGDHEEGRFGIVESGLYEVLYIALRKSPTPPRREYEDVIWLQKVYVPYPKPSNHRFLADQYKPIIVFHKEEKYFPQPLAHILNVGKGFGLVKAWGEVVILETGDILKSYLSTHGDTRFLINAAPPSIFKDSPGELESSRVYYDIFEIGSKIYLSYYFFYSYDPKVGGVTGLFAEHTLDRESFTIVLDKLTKEPEAVVYGMHLPDQVLGFLGCSNDCQDSPSDAILKWKGGKVRLDWQAVPRQGNNPVVFIAKGSHAIFPTCGWYKVSFLKEPTSALSSLNTALPEVDLLSVTDSNQGYLRFSGYWIDGFASNDSRFPPFIRIPPYWTKNATSPFNKLLIGGNIQDDEVRQMKSHFGMCLGWVANHDVGVTYKNQPLVIDVLHNDLMGSWGLDFNSVDLTLVKSPSNGTCVIDSEVGTRVIYTPDQGYITPLTYPPAPDTCTYVFKPSDAPNEHFISGEASVSVTVLDDIPPAAFLSASPNSGQAPLTVTLNAKDSIDDRGIVKYSFSTGQSGSKGTAVVTYETAGTYTPSVIVKDISGQTDSASVTIEVKEPLQPPPCDPNVDPICSPPPCETDCPEPVTLPPSASLITLPKEGGVPLAVLFDATNSTDDFGITHYEFDLGDGKGVTNSSGEFLHTYMNPGVYAASVKVFDAEGQSDMGYQEVIANEVKIIVSGNPTPAKVCPKPYLLDSSFMDDGSIVPERVISFPQCGGEFLKLSSGEEYTFPHVLSGTNALRLDYIKADDAPPRLPDSIYPQGENNRYHPTINIFHPPWLPSAFYKVFDLAAGSSIELRIEYERYTSNVKVEVQGNPKTIPVRVGYYGGKTLFYSPSLASGGAHTFTGLLPSSTDTAEYAFSVASITEITPDNCTKHYTAPKQRISTAPGVDQSLIFTYTSELFCPDSDGL